MEMLPCERDKVSEENTSSHRVKGMHFSEETVTKLKDTGGGALMLSDVIRSQICLQSMFTN